MQMKKVYLDNAATTKCDKRVVETMMPFFTEKYAVASSEFSHSPGIDAKDALDNARSVIADKIGAETEEVVFTSGGTESNNTAIKATAVANRKKGNHIITCSTEHRSVLESVRSLEKQGFEITVLPVSGTGLVSPDDLKSAITRKTILVSIQMVNQETGIIQDIASIGKICRETGVIFHTDAALGYCRLPINVEEYQIDLLSITAHKIHGPKGVGAIYVRNGLGIPKWMDGGYNEFNKRGGTENVAGVVGFAKATELIEPNEIKQIERLRRRLYEGIKKNLEYVKVNGAMERSVPTILNVSFKYVEGESVLLHLDMRGIAVITGSACFSRSLEPSYVLKTMGLSHEDAHGSIRFSFSRFNTNSEIDYVVDSVRDVVKKLREISPIGPHK